MRKHPHLANRRRLIAASILGLAPCSALAATAYSWNIGINGVWGTACNWTPTGGPPGALDTAQFNLPNTYTVTLDVPPTVTSFSLGGSNLTIGNSTVGRTITSGTMFLTSGSLTLNAATPMTFNTTNNTQFNVNVAISNGNHFSVAGVGAGLAANSSCTTSVDGTGSSFNTSSLSIATSSFATTGSLNFTNSATGSLGSVTMAGSGTTTAFLNISSDADVSAGSMNLATTGGTGQSAIVTVSGTGSTLSANSLITIGSGTNSQGTMNITGGGALSAAGITVNGNGELDVNSSSVTFAGNLTLNSGTAGRGNVILTGSGTTMVQTAGGSTLGGNSGNTVKLQVNSGTSFTAGNNSMNVNATGLVDINDGTFISNGFFNVAGGTIQKSLAGTFTWSSGRSMSMSTGGKVKITGDFTTPGNDSITVTGSGSAFQQLVTGTLSVVSGSTISAQNTASLSAINVNLGTAAGSASTMTVDGSGTTATTSTLTVGNGSVNSATVNLQNSGVATVSGQLTVNGGGLININGGTLVMTGDALLNGGTVTQQSTAGSTWNWSTGHMLTAKSGAQINLFGTYLMPGNSTWNVSGASTQITVTGGSGFNVVNGATLNLNGATINPNGVLAIDTFSQMNFNGGTITTTELRTLGNPAGFSWASGTLNITGAGGLEVGNSSQLGSNVSVPAGGILNITNALTIDSFAKIQTLGPLTAGSMASSGELDGIGTTINLPGASIMSGSAKINLIGTTLNLGTGGNKLTNAGRINLTDLTVNGDIQNTGGVINTAGNVSFNGSIMGGAAPLQISDGVTTLLPSGNRVADVSSLTLGGSLDLTNNKLIVAGGTLGSWNGSNYDGITGSIKSGRNGGGWNGSGIVTSQTNANGIAPLTTVAVALAGDISKMSLGGISVAPNDVLAMYTYAGDANLSGAIDGDDYFRIDNGFTSHATGYENGDFNYDGKINADDYFIIDKNYSRQGGAFAAGPLPGGVTVVPEPAALFTAALFSLARRRPQRRPAHRRATQNP